MSTSASVKDVASLAALLSSVGFEGVVAESDFEFPNFPLVAQLLYWMTCLLKGDARISQEISTDRRRIAFLKNCGTAIVRETGIRLSLTTLYRGDVDAAKELLKVATFLKKAQRLLESERATDGLFSSNSRSAPNRLDASVFETGASLQSVLCTEQSLCRKRLTALLDECTYNVESSDWSQAVRGGVEDTLSAMAEEMCAAKQRSAHLRREHARVAAECSRKQADCERFHKRLLAFSGLRPEEVVIEEVVRQCAAAHSRWMRNHLQRTHLHKQLEHYTKLESQRRNRHNQLRSAAQRRQRELQTDEQSSHSGMSTSLSASRSLTHSVVDALQLDSA